MSQFSLVGGVLREREKIFCIYSGPQFWADEANTNKKRDKRDMASAFYAVLEPIVTEFGKIETLQLVDAEEVLEIVHNGLDDLWKVDEWEYPQKRMVHFMDVLANALTRFLQSKYSTLDIWKGPFSQIEESLQTVRKDFFQNPHHCICHQCYI